MPCQIELDSRPPYSTAIPQTGFGRPLPGCGTNVAAKRRCGECKMVEVEAGQGSSAIFSKTPTTRSLKS
jgi:hypothetical protein